MMGIVRQETKILRIRRPMIIFNTTDVVCVGPRNSLFEIGSMFQCFEFI